MAQKTGPSVRSVGVLVAVVHLGVLTYLSLLPVFLRNEAWGLESLRRAVTNWDANHYLRLAREGYSAEFLAVYLPLYPSVVGTLRFVTGDAVLAALLVSLVAHVLAGTALFRLARLDAPDLGWRSVVSLLAFPTAVAAVLPYTESLFMALTLHAVLAFREGRHGRAGALGLLASLTRLPGLALVGLFATEFLTARDRAPTRRVLVAVLLPLVGLAGYLALNAYVYGDAFFFVGVQKNNFYRSLAWPQRGFAEALGSLGRRPPEGLTVGLSDLVGGLLAWATAIYALLRLRASYGVFALACAVLVTFQAWWQSNLRYCWAIFPVHLMLARLSGRGWVGQVLLVAGIVLQALLALQYARGAWAF